MGTPFRALCACTAQPSASCVLGGSALLMGRGGSSAAGAEGRKVTPLGAGNRCLGSPVAPENVPVMGSGSLDVGGRGKQVPEGPQCWQP